MARCCSRRLGILLFLSAINIVNFIDRGIMAGAPVDFEDFITHTLQCPRSHTATWLGVLQSSFIAVYSVACIVFSQLRHSVPAFRLLGSGLVIWVVALFLSALAYWLPQREWSFWAFLFARALSGVGEASFQCIVPPYVEDFSPAARKTLWLAIFYTVPTQPPAPQPHPRLPARRLPMRRRPSRSARPSATCMARSWLPPSDGAGHTYSRGC